LSAFTLRDVLKVYLAFFIFMLNVSPVILLFQYNYYESASAIWCLCLNVKSV